MYRPLYGTSLYAFVPLRGCRHPAACVVTHKQQARVFVSDCGDEGAERRLCEGSSLSDNWLIERGCVPLYSISGSISRRADFDFFFFCHVAQIFRCRM